MARKLILHSIALILFAGVHYSIAQEKVSIEAIPHILTWENQPISFSSSEDSLIIVAGPTTDMFRDPNVTYNTDNAPKLLFKPDGDFVLTASIEHAFENKWDGGAIVLKKDSLNWIKFCFEKDYTGARRVVSVVTRDISDDCNSVEIDSNKVRFKVARAGKVITLYCSNDGQDWLLVRHLQFEGCNDLKVGFLSQSPTGKQCRATFSNIIFDARTISDPYLGE